MKSTNWKILVALVFIAGAIASCQIKANKEKENNEGIGETAFIPCCGEPSSNENILTIKLAVNDTYCKQTACICIHEVAGREYQELQEKLKSEYNIDLQLTYFMEPYDMEGQLKAKSFDGVICKPWNAFMLSKDYNIRYKRIVDIKDVYNSQWLKGVFMVPKDSPIQTLADIEGKTLVAGQEDAYEKFHAPLRMLEQKGINPGRIYYKASCLENINELLDKNAEVAIVSDYVMTASCAVDIAKPEDFRIIGETETMPLTSVILDMDKISKEDAMRLQKALLELSNDKSPESMLSDGFVAPEKWEPVPFVKSI